MEGATDSLRVLYNLLNRSGLEVDATWKKGQPTRGGRVHSASGFKLAVADAASSGKLVEEVRVFLRHCNEHGVTFAAPQISAEMSLGVTVGCSKQYTATVAFSPSDLLAFGQQGIALSFAAYPTSDEAITVDAARRIVDAHQLPRGDVVVAEIDGDGNDSEEPDDPSRKH